jgi:hypothetical protein
VAEANGAARWRVLLSCAAAYVLATAAFLPDPVASHFGPGGAANGSMPRTVYVVFMLLLVVGLPAFVVWASSAALARPGARINLPHRDYWLAPERREQSLAAIRTGMRQFAEMLVCFLCYAQALVVRANQVQPAHLDSAWFDAGLAVFFVVFLWWLRRFLRRFRRAT